MGHFFWNKTPRILEKEVVSSSYAKVNQDKTFPTHLSFQERKKCIAESILSLCEQDNVDRVFRIRTKCYKFHNNKKSGARFLVWHFGPAPASNIMHQDKHTSNLYIY